MPTNNTPHQSDLDYFQGIHPELFDAMQTMTPEDRDLRVVQAGFALQAKSCMLGALELAPAYDPALHEEHPLLQNVLQQQRAQRGKQYTQRAMALAAVAGEASATVVFRNHLS